MQQQQQQQTLRNEILQSQKKVMDAQFKAQQAQLAWEDANPEMAQLKRIPEGPLRDMAMLQMMGGGQGLGGFGGQPQLQEQEIAGPIEQGQVGPLTTTIEQPGQQPQGLAGMIFEKTMGDITGIKPGVKSFETFLDPETGAPVKQGLGFGGQTVGPKRAVQEDLVKVVKQTPQGEVTQFIPKSEATAVQILTGPNKWDSEVFRAESIKMPERKKMADKSYEAVGVYDKLLGLAKAGNVTGKWGKFKAWASPYLEMVEGYAEKLGIDIENITDAELFTLTARALIGEYRIDIIGPGPVSEYEQLLMDRMSGGGGTGRKAAIELLERWQGKAKVNVDTYNTTAKGMHDFSSLSKSFYPIIGESKKGNKQPSLGLGKKDKPPLSSFERQ
jgi:hypothetical protein